MQLPETLRAVFARARRTSLSKRAITSAISFVLLLALYFFSEWASKTSSQSTAVFTIGTHHFPYSSMAGVFSSLMTIILIWWVILYRSFGFYSALTILIFRIVTLLIRFNDNHYHVSSLPAIFITLAAIVSIALIYWQNEKILRMQEKHRKELEKFNRSIIGAFANCIDGKDEYTNGHSLRVAKYTRLLAQRLGESSETVEKFYNIALLHDIGKIGIPDAILNKPGKLTTEEFDLMKSHPMRGYAILKDVKIQDDIAVGARHHHERFDGNGYPDGLSGYHIPWVARIIAVADAFDAMNSTRPYRKQLPMDSIVQEITHHSSTQFDPTVVDAFLALHSEGAFQQQA